MLLADPWSGARLAWKAVVPEELAHRWRGIQEQYIIMVEQAAVTMGIIEARQVLAGCDVIWYEDISGA